MVLAGKRRKRHRLRCLFCVGNCLLVAMLQSAPLFAAHCLSGAAAESISDVRAIDGDSLQLADGQQVRLIGVNALEMHARTAGESALARQAHDALQTLVQHTSLELIPGIESRDRHGRLLAHLRLNDGRLVSEVLVRRGLAVAVAVGPNVRCARRLQSLERHARQARRGIWQHPAGWLHVSGKPGSLTETPGGFRILQGTVSEVNSRRSGVVLRLDNGLEVRLGRHWPRHMPWSEHVAQLARGQQVRVRGWVDSSRNTQRLTLHHPANLELIEN